VARRADCGILLDVNNLYVSACNHGFDPLTYLDELPAECIAEYHLAGHTVRQLENTIIRLDTHNQRVIPAVWALYGEVLRRFGPRPTLIEWDTDLPPLATLLEEAAIADQWRVASGEERVASGEERGASGEERVVSEAAQPPTETEIALLWDSTPLATRSSLLATNLQRAFARALVAVDAPALMPWVQANGLEPARRLQIYRNNGRTGLAEALAAVYPVVRRLVGEDWFRQATRRYARKWPSRSGNLHDFGDHFPRYLARLPGTRELPYLADVARLEWAYHRVFHAADHAPLDPARLAAVPPEHQAALRLRLHPAARLVVSPYPVFTLWQANQEGGDGRVDLAIGGERVLVIRRGLDIEMERLSVAEHALLAACATDMPLGEGCAAALKAQPDFDLAGCLGWHIGRGTLVDFALDGPAPSGISHPASGGNPC
jgi:hypothetical protein